MNLRINNLCAAALLSAIGLAGAVNAGAATYNGDLLIGFTITSGNDLIYDLGAASSLTNGQSWNLSSSLSSYNLNAVDWGVIGDKNVSGTHYAWTTTPMDTVPPFTLAGTAAWAYLDQPMRSIYQNFADPGGAGESLSINSSDDNSWNMQTVQSTNRVPSRTAYSNYQDPNVMGTTSDKFYQIVADGSAPALLGSFTLGPDGVVTFNTVSTAPQIVGVTRIGDTSTISFTTTSGLTYSLAYTNADGLTTPVAGWPTTGTVSGDGLTNSLSDTTTDANRFYRVVAH